MSPNSKYLSPSFNVLLLVPTGIKAAIGGYAGDALPVARAIASIADNVITHPNVLNGASLYWSMPNVLYTEGMPLIAWQRVTGGCVRSDPIA